MLAVALALMVQQPDRPPVSASACFNGGCIEERWPRDLLIVFFPDRATTLPADDRRTLDKFARQHRWWPDLMVTVCTPPRDRLTRQRVAAVRSVLRREDWTAVRVQEHGRNCTLGGGPDRAPGFSPIQLTLGPDDTKG